jgi:hypothetical protein
MVVAVSEDQMRTRRPPQTLRCEARRARDTTCVAFSRKQFRGDPVPKAEPLPLDSQLCFSIYSASISFQRVYKPMLDALGVTYTPQYLVLSALWERDGLMISAIGDRLALEPSTITPAVKQNGLPDRRTSPFALRCAADDRGQQTCSNPPTGHAQGNRQTC